ncbi:hypothetical protein TNCV_4801191 [Trichonephila clavipes]|nr:hypothetical protein TNCV_4801191 [Trichonephila clavipes]
MSRDLVWTLILSIPGLEKAWNTIPSLFLQENRLMQQGRSNSWNRNGVLRGRTQLHVFDKDSWRDEVVWRRGECQLSGS